MRTSHIAIRKKIAEEKNNLTDEQIFASPHYAAYLTDITEGITKRHKRSTKVCVFWDDAPDAETAYTDSRIISINAGNRLTQSFPTRSLKADSILGIAGHECGHILFSDFTMLQTYLNAVASGKFYPSIPTELSSIQQNSLTEILKEFTDANEAVILAVSNIAHTLANVMEDVYIEGRMCDAFPGSIKTGILLNNIRFAEEMDTVTEQIQNGHHEVFILTNLLIQYAKTGDLNNLDGYSGPYLNTVYDCIPYIDDASYDDDAKARFDAANQILLFLWLYMKSYIDKIQNDLKNKTQTAAQDFAEQVSGGTPLPLENSRPVPQKNHAIHHPSDDEEEREHLRQVLDYEEGRILLEKTDDIGEDGTGGISKGYGLCRKRLYLSCCIRYGTHYDDAGRRTCLYPL